MASFDEDAFDKDNAFDDQAWNFDEEAEPPVISGELGGKFVSVAVHVGCLLLTFLFYSLYD